MLAGKHLPLCHKLFLQGGLRHHQNAAFVVEHGLNSAERQNSQWH